MRTDPKAVAGRFYEIVNDHAAGTLGTICAADLRGHAGAGANLDELVASIGSFSEAFPDLRVEVTHLVCEDDMVSSWARYEGTHLGEFAGVAGTGHRVTFAAWDLFRVEDGQVVELTMYCDLFTLMNQMGALPTASPA